MLSIRLSRFWAAVFAVLCLALPCALAQDAPSVAVTLVSQSGTVDITPVSHNGVDWLFLPAFVKGDELSATVDGQPATVRIGDTAENYVYPGEVLVDGEVVLTLQVMRSENLRAFFLFSDDPVNYGRLYIEDCDLHQNFTTGSMALVDADGCVDHVEDIRKLRGRGNGTWYDVVKKGYQIKLENRVDLLDTGVADERNRIWLLLAEGRDHTMLRNRMSLDLALELGLSQTSRSEHVDLYYDGEYRGTYLLAEKVEVNEGRVDVLDYDDLIESWNEQIGQYDLDALPAAYGHNQYGNLYNYIEGVADNEDPGAGSFLLEMENEFITLSDRCWFRLSDGSALASKSPENASEPMMRYISERLESARRTLTNRGVNPENGRTIEDDFNVDAFARTALLHELSCNEDGFVYSSSFFVLPAGQTRFEPGPIWDFEFTYRKRRDWTGLERLKDDESWLMDFYSVPAFRDAMQKALRDDLTPLIRDIVLGTKEGKYLKPLDTYMEEIRASLRMNGAIWVTGTDGRYEFASSAEESLERMKEFLDVRLSWMCDEILSWSQTDADDVDLWVDAVYSMMEPTLTIHVQPWANVQVVDFTLEQLTEADEENYAQWQLDAVVAPLEGFAFGEPAVTLNGTPVAHERQEDGTLRLCATFEDLSYRPVDYYGEDIGLIYNYEEYLHNHPEVVELCGDDPEDVMNYFMDEGIYEGHQGNAFFNPKVVKIYRMELPGMFGESWDLYYWDFLYYGYEEWMASVKTSDARFRPVFTDAL